MSIRDVHSFIAENKHMFEFQVNYCDYKSKDEYDFVMDFVTNRVKHMHALKKIVIVLNDITIWKDPGLIKFGKSFPAFSHLVYFSFTVKDCNDIDDSILKNIYEGIQMLKMARELEFAFPNC